MFRKLIWVYALFLLLACGDDSSDSSSSEEIIFADLMIQESDLSVSATWTVANSMCENSAVDNYNNWRLPNLAELGVIYSNKKTIKGLSKSDCAIKESCFYSYWSSEEYTLGSYHYFYSITTGNVDSKADSSKMAVRCVRSISEDGLQTQTNAVLKIQNESSLTLENVIWNDVNFGSIATGKSVIRPVRAGQGYIHFKIPSKDLNASTSDIVIVEQDSTKEFQFLNTTIILDKNSNTIVQLNKIDQPVESPDNSLTEISDESIFAALRNKTLK